ncbi:MAG: hypothetical protein A2W91_10485 [Bacteroidetes bacterium GWF2_38_335]|nr:MAG: hypothetical protein A2W91_10485 [Bacteroidetes bacterium GWF2_38_335]OFY81869.1 MAG: hypothetical protein A2281_06555 [Bacteroidetes bacterium RIFOXYA12_FULL_38_20]HBS87946.1 hypothetical protein [Bacteroidales bacterium]
MKLLIGLLLITEIVIGQFTTSINPGISLNEFKNTNKGIIPEKVYFEKYVTLNDRLCLIDGDFGLNFSKDTLVSVLFSSTGGHFYPGIQKDPSLIKKAFDEQYEAFLSVFDDYSRLFGTPDSLCRADTLFKGYSEEMYTYKIIHARWDLEKTIIDLDFDFSGINESQYFEINAAPTTYYYSFKAFFRISTTKGEQFKGKFNPGTSIHEFVREFPGLIEGGASITGVWSDVCEYAGINGSVSYTFEYDTLLHYTFQPFNKYNEDNEANLKVLLKAYETAKAELTKIYGDPSEIIEDNKKPYQEIKKKYIYGCEIAISKWKFKDVWVILRLDISGGKGETWLDFTVNVCRPGDFSFEY